MNSQLLFLAVDFDLLKVNQLLESTKINFSKTNVLVCLSTKKVPPVLDLALNDYIHKMGADMNRVKNISQDGYIDPVDFSLSVLKTPLDLNVDLAFGTIVLKREQSDRIFGKLLGLKN